jgi:glucokinase
LGAGRGAEIVFGITLGTGVGGGIVINNKIYRGATGSAVEAGHMTIKFDGLKCSCGNLGCLEAYCSEKFFKKKGISPKEAAKKAKAGNKFALKIFKDYGKNLGVGLSNIINLLDPEIIVLGGGISKASKFFLEETKKETKKRTISPLSKKYVKIKIAKLGEIAGALGAALLVDY